MRTLIYILIAVAFITQGCKIIRPGVNTTKSESSTVEYKPVDIAVSGAKVGTSLNIDSLLLVAIAKRDRNILDSIKAVQAGRPLPSQPQKKTTITDPHTKAELTYWVDQYGKLQISCESKDQIVKMLVAEVTRLSKEVTHKTEVVNKTPIWNWIAVAVLGTLLIISMIFNLLNFKRK